jgi:CDGSH-type Zn-finger protein
LETREVGIRRTCNCGCGHSLEGRRKNTSYFDGTHRVRAHKARRAAIDPETPHEPSVTLARPLNGRSGDPEHGEVPRYGRLKTKAELGLVEKVPPGPARLLEALVLRGLRKEHLKVAAALCIALDEGLE